MNQSCFLLFIFTLFFSCQNRQENIDNLNTEQTIYEEEEGEELLFEQKAKEENVQDSTLFVVPDWLYAKCPKKLQSSDYEWQQEILSAYQLNDSVLICTYRKTGNVSYEEFLLSFVNREKLDSIEILNQNDGDGGEDYTWKKYDILSPRMVRVTTFTSKGEKVDSIENRYHVNDKGEIKPFTISELIPLLLKDANG